MVKAKGKGPLIEKSVSVKNEKKKFNKNSSFNGVELKKSPKNRRKSIAAVLPTPLKKKKEKTFNEWTVSESSPKSNVVCKTKLGVSTALTDDDVGITTSLLKTPQIKKKKQSKTILASEKKKPPKKSPNVKKRETSNEKKEAPKKQDIRDKEIEADEKFGIGPNTIAKAVQAVIKLHRENPKLQNQLFDDPIEIFLQLSCHRVPRGPSRIIRIPLPNTLLTPDDEVCLIVPELKGVKNKEHEKHIEHYENLLQQKGVENIKKIMTFHQFRTEYETFEQKLRLVDLYDMFLVDGRISGKVVKKCGKIFYKKRKVPTSVKLQATKLKDNVDKALSKAFFLLHLKGDSYNVQFGHEKMEIQDLVDNALATIECLSKEFPGGLENIKGLHIYTTRGTSVPIYSSFKNPAEVILPEIVSKKPKAYKTYKGELTTMPNVEVTVLPTGQVIVERTELEEDNVNEENSKAKKAKKRKLSEDIPVETIKNVEDSPATISNIVTKKKKKQKVNGDKVEDNLENVETIKNVEESPATISNIVTKKKKKQKVKGEKAEDNLENAVKEKKHKDVDKKNKKLKKNVKEKSEESINVNKKVKKNKKGLL